MCFNFRRRKSDPAKNGASPKIPKPDKIQGSKDQPEDAKKVGTIRPPLKNPPKPPPLSSTPPSDEQNSVVMLVRRQTLDNFLTEMNRLNAEKQSLDQRLNTWRTNLTSRVESRSSPELRIKLNEHLDQLIKDLKEAVCTAAAINTVLSKKPIPNLEHERQSVRLQDQFSQIRENLDAVFGTWPGFKNLMTATSGPVTIKAEITEFFQAVFTLEKTLSKLKNVSHLI